MPNLGSKIEYPLGNATGNLHNVQRSKSMANQLGKIGIHDNDAGRKILVDHFENTYYNNLNIINENEITIVNSLLFGPGGSVGVESVWQENKLITMKFFE